MQLTLVRHTRIDVPTGICYGQTDVPLAKSFEQEAENVRKALQNKSFDHVLSSPLSRCTKLARHCVYSDFVEDPRLKEFHFGEWEMTPWEDIRGPFAERWMKEYYTTPCPGGESLQDLIDRIQLFIFDLQQNTWDKVLVFTHAGPIRIFLHLLNGLDKDRLFETKIDYGEIVEINA